MCGYPAPMTGSLSDGGTRATTRTGQPLACVVINPSKPRASAAVRGLLERELHEAGYAGPVWLETSVSEPGTMQARLALAAGARLVVAAGGDGTVRSVAAGVAGTEARMGIIPLGTANLAARNLGVPVGNPRAAARVAVHGVDLPADLAVGDVLAVPATGAYGRSMASNYNLFTRPGVRWVREGESGWILRPETIEDLLRLEN